MTLQSRRSILRVNALQRHSCSLSEDGGIKLKRIYSVIIIQRIIIEFGFYEIDNGFQI